MNRQFCPCLAAPVEYLGNMSFEAPLKLLYDLSVSFWLVNGLMDGRKLTLWQFCSSNQMQFPPFWPLTLSSCDLWSGFSAIMKFWWWGVVIKEWPDSVVVIKRREGLCPVIALRNVPQALPAMCSQVWGESVYTCACVHSNFLRNTVKPS